MRAFLAGLLLAAAPPSWAGPVEVVVPVDLGLPGVWALGPMSGVAPTPIGTALPLAVSPSLPVFLTPSVVRPAIRPAAPVAAARAAAPGTAPLARRIEGENLPAQDPAEETPEKTPLETQTSGGRRTFDGAGQAPEGGDAPAVPPGPPADGGGRSGEPGPGWSMGSFESAAGGEVAFKRRPGAPEAPARVYSGGLALNESFEPLFAGERRSAGGDYFLWTRGHPPTGWTPTASPLDADARDLARMIVAAARESGSKKVELALHSFGTLVFQRLLQLRREPEVKAALRLLAGSRVVLLNATTHHPGSERKAGREFEQMAQGTKMFVDWLDGMDAAAAAWETTAVLQPLLAPSIRAWLSVWRLQRGQAVALASKSAADMMRKDLEAPWDPAVDGIRRGFLRDLERDVRDPGWQEALLRRSSDMFRLDFGAKDVAFLRRLKIRLDLVHSSRDQLLNWESAKILFQVLGIEAPEQAPGPGAVLADRSGLFRARIVDADHYYPLKQRDELGRLLDP